MEEQKQLRYGENPHQKGYFYGNLDAMFDQIHGKEISYNNLLDINAAVDLIDEFYEVTFAILKHNNACGLASRPTVLEAWKDALAGDPVSAFGGVLVTNAVIDKETAEDLVLRLSRAGVKVIIYADGIPKDKRTHSQNFLGVTCSLITLDIQIWIQELERYIQICFLRDILHGIQCILMDLILCGELFMIMD